VIQVAHVQTLFGRGARGNVTLVFAQARRWCVALLAAATLGACTTPPPLPLYAPMQAPDAPRTIAPRHRLLQTLSARADVRLTDANGRSISLDGALVVSMPDQMRLRCWKLGRAALDLTVKGNRAWLMTARDEPAVADTTFINPGAVPQSASTRQMRAALDLLGPAFFESAAELPGLGGPEVFWVSGPALGRSDARCEINRATLTPRRFVIVDDTGQTRAELTLSNYVAVADQRAQAEPTQVRLFPTAFVGTLTIPTRIDVRAVRPDGAPGGQITVELDELEVNAPLASAAFVPPSTARELP